MAQEQRPQALEFPQGLPWLNVSRPLTMKDLRGKVVILDFWTYGCINCMHILPDLRRLEKRFGHKLAIIGVHSPKFENEKRLETLRQVILRYDIEHPVVNDTGFTLWRAYGVRAWPTLIVIDPEGKVVGQVAGEGHYA
ncbi:MAG: thiol-disulfide isomerase, partial [Gammaproteobacteria bacterium]